jgi:pyruvate carboxylase
VQIVHSHLRSHNQDELHPHKNALHRYKADESYLVGKDLGPAESYLNIERIIDHNVVQIVHSHLRSHNQDELHPHQLVSPHR